MIYTYNNIKPIIHISVFIADGTRIIGDVTIGEYSSIWFNTVIRGDINPIRIGKRTNIQDNCTLHVGEHEPCIIGDNVTVGHHVNLHGCTVHNNVLIGIGAIVLTGSVVGDGAVIAAGSVVVEGMQIPEKALVMGIPAKIKCILDPAQKQIKTWADEYVQLAEEYKKIVKG